MALFLAPLLAQALSVNVGASTEARVRSTAADLRYDNVTMTRGALLLNTERTSWELSYSPSLSYLDLGEPTLDRTVMHTGGLTARLQLSRRTLAYFTESASYGTRNFRVMAVDASGFAGAQAGTTSSGSVPTQPDTSQIQTTPQVTRRDGNIRYGSVTTAASLMHQLTRRTSGSVSAGYSVTGGTDQESQSIYPRFKELQESGQVTYAVSPHDGLSLRAQDTWITTSLKRRANMATFEAEWAHEYSATTTSTVSVGPAVWDWRQGGGEERWGVMPAGSATLRYRRPLRDGDLQFNVMEQVSPSVDRILGTVNPQSMTNVSLGLAFDEFTARTNGYAAVTGATMARSSGITWGAEEALAYSLSRAASVEIGTRQTVLGAADEGPTTVLWSVYVSVSVSSGDLRL